MNLNHLHLVKGKVWAVGILYVNPILLELCIKPRGQRVWPKHWNLFMASHNADH